MRKTTATFLLLILVFLLLTAQTSCRERACEHLQAIDKVLQRLADLGIVFDSLEDFLWAVGDGRLEGKLAEMRKGHAQAVAAIELLLVIIRALCPPDRAELDDLMSHAIMRWRAAPPGDGVLMLEGQLEGILERSRTAHEGH